MHARLTQFEVPPEKADEAIRSIEGAVAQWKQVDGYRGMTYLLDRATGKVAVVTFWESEQKLAAAEEALTQGRDQAVRGFAPAAAPTSQRYEVVLSELPAG